jgi:hypothetical protein
VNRRIAERPPTNIKTKKKKKKSRRKKKGKKERREEKKKKGWVGGVESRRRIGDLLSSPLKIVFEENGRVAFEEPLLSSINLGIHTLIFEEPKRVTMLENTRHLLESKFIRVDRRK